MTAAQLIASVPVRIQEGREYVRVNDIPEPDRDRFLRAMRGCNRPQPEGEVGLCAHVADWDTWAHGSWVGVIGPQWKDSTPEPKP